MKRKFNLKMISDLDYDDLVADVCFENNSLGTISQDEGIDKMEIEIPLSDQGEGKIRVPLDDYIEILKKAKNNLIYMRKISENENKDP